MMMTNAELYTRVMNIMNADNFDKSLRPVAEFMKEYSGKYSILPDVTQIKATTGVELEVIEDFGDKHTEWFLAEFESFTKRQELERAILKSADLLEKGDFGPVEKLIKDAVQISLQRDMGTDYFEDPRARLEGLKNSNGQVSTGWPSVDKKLYGGFNRGELNIWCAASGGGKSLFLANLGCNWALQGLNVLYLTFELSENLVAMRIDSMLTGVGTREIFRNLDDVELKVKMLGKQSGSVQIKYMPSGKNANDIRAYLKEYQVKKGFKPDILLIDYLDLMMPMSIKVSPSDLFVKDKYVSEELRNLAMETQAVVVTAAQLNRAAVEEIEFDHSHISGGLSKIQTADNVIGIFTSRAMKERGRYQIQFMKTRSSSGVGQKVDLEFNLDSLRINDLGEDEDGYQKPKTSVYEGLKKTSTVVDQSTGEIRDPNEGISVGKIKGVTGSSKIREMLAGLNSEKD